eukprot:TRINITY_DN60110_c0_g1_i1.p1 TRINITY_DN60110_c0_g1~~TRINITY_DN60110_c0_g1_i1.p1  ORF type:complete len:791 (-),score=135.21 TRINITY_DN60110_c0_g1_i1:75-2294(-)
MSDCKAPACAWNPVNNKCASACAPPAPVCAFCPNITTQSACNDNKNNPGCAWAGGKCASTCGATTSQMDCMNPSKNPTCAWVSGKCQSKCAPPPPPCVFCGNITDSNVCNDAKKSPGCAWFQGKCVSTCGAITSMMDCSPSNPKAATCTWNPMSNRCSSLCKPPKPPCVFCGNVTDQTACTDAKKSPGCGWANGKCATICPAQTTSSDCSNKGAGACTWNPVTNKCSSMCAVPTCVDCTKVTDQSTCGTTGNGCTWSGGKCMSQCNSITDMMKCATGTNCAYNPTTSKCSSICEKKKVDVPCVLDCSSQDASSCGYYSLCRWQGNACAKGCGMMATQSKCSADSTCSWNGKKCMEACSKLDMLSCSLTYNCNWNPATSKCGPDCIHYVAQSTCSAASSMGCSWQSKYNACSNGSPVLSAPVATPPPKAVASVPRGGLKMPQMVVRPMSTTMPPFGGMPPRTVTMPPRSVTMPPRSITMPPRSVTMPPRSITMPPRSMTMPPMSISSPPTAGFAPSNFPPPPPVSVMAPKAVSGCNQGQLQKCLQTVKGSSTGFGNQCPMYHQFAGCATTANCPSVLSVWCNGLFKQARCSISKCKGSGSNTGSCKTHQYQLCLFQAQSTLGFNPTACQRAQAYYDCAKAASCSTFEKTACQQASACGIPGCSATSLGEALQADAFTSSLMLGTATHEDVQQHLGVTTPKSSSALVVVVVGVVVAVVAIVGLVVLIARRRVQDPLGYNAY